MIIGKSKAPSWIDPMRRLAYPKLILVVAAMVLITPEAKAHPHVWIAAKAEVLFGGKGEIVAIRNTWVFDEMYSAFVTEGQSKDGKLLTKEDLAPLAKTNVTDMAEFGFFTFAKAASARVEFGEPTDYSLEEREDKLVVMNFTLPLKNPASAAKAFSLQVYDPTYFVAFELDPKDPIGLVDAPSGCSTNVLGAKPLVSTETQKLSEAFFSGLSPGADFGVKLASRIIVACP